MEENPKVSLRIKYKKTFELAVIMSLALHTIVFISSRKLDPSEQKIISQQEIKIRDALISSYEIASFKQLMEIRYSLSKRCPGNFCEQQKAFELSYEQKGTQRSFQINKLLEDCGRTFSGKEVFLDIGCGSGTAVPWIMKGFKKGIAVDYSLVDLIIGSKFLEENRISNLKLVCADARSLPLSDGVFDFVNATDVIEHILPGQELFVEEVKRVLKKGGGFYFNSPNRYNLFTPEPHVKVRLVGFMPRAWMNRYVQIMKGVNYTTVRLLSLIDLQYLVRNKFSKDFFLTGPFVDLSAPGIDLKRKVIKQIPFLLTFINRCFRFFTTNYHVIAFKN